MKIPNIPSKEELSRDLEEAVTYGLLEKRYSLDGEPLYEAAPGSEKLLADANAVAKKHGIDASQMTIAEFFEAVLPLMDSKS